MQGSFYDQISGKILQLEIDVADIWKEAYKPKHKGLLAAYPRKHMWGFQIPPDLPWTLSPKEVWYVKVCTFTFVFHSPDQLNACLDYYSKKVHPSSLIPGDELFDYGGDSSECQRWFDRLPMYLLEEPKRKKVVAALRTASRRWAEDNERLKK